MPAACHARPLSIGEMTACSNRIPLHAPSGPMPMRVDAALMVERSVGSLAQQPCMNPRRSVAPIRSTHQHPPMEDRAMTSGLIHHPKR